MYVGEKIICKKNYDDIYHEGIEYIILKISSTLSSKNLLRIGAEGSENYYLLWDSEVYEYFYTQVELRKIKLERLKNI